MGRDFEIDIVIGKAIADMAQIRSLAASFGAELHVGVKIAEMAQLILRADLAIGTSGSSALERCALGLPALMITVADNQALMARNLTRLNAATFLGTSADVTAELIQNAVQWLQERPEILEAQSCQAFEICDGAGASRTANKVSEICRD